MNNELSRRIFAPLLDENTEGRSTSLPVLAREEGRMREGNLNTSLITSITSSVSSWQATLMSKTLRQ